MPGRARLGIQIYASELPDPYLKRRQEFGRLFYGSLGIRQADAEARSRQTAKNYTFFGAPVGLIVTIDRRLEAGSWLDLGMFVQNVMLAAAGRGLQSCPQETFSKYHRILRPPALDSGGADSGVRHLGREARSRGAAIDAAGACR
ncbi:nitroreductase family protein [Bradyrhizobium sp. 146]|uniref:nitroreductase family protein n=1 Tax=Bradyrhizobium sp. 146 TaxID=2782622 RepID=UPI002096B302|nr:nitroreductase family protein [Bradyrhizobium sp. 146]